MTNKWRYVAVRTGLSVVAALATAGTAHTYAAWSDFKDIKGNTVGGAVWAPDPPAACGPIADYNGGVVYGTLGNDVLNLSDNNQRQIVMGLSGDDVIYGGNAGDCLVGGDGNDKIYGNNAADILIGGAGDDYLNGANGPDTLDGGDGTDACVGGHAPDVTTNCESTP